MPNQIYRGNSEQKLYYLLNNFVGGMNTVDVDEVISPNEFRELKNVDLSKQGMLQNRKGFKHLKLLNSLLLENGDVRDLLSDDEVLYFKVVEDNIKLLDVLSRYDDIETFKSDYADTYYYFHILLVTTHQNPARFELNYITLENDGIDWEHYSSVFTLYTGYGLTKPKTLTGLKPVTLGNLMYFSIQDISVDVVGILELKMVSDMYLGETRPDVRLINASGGYYVTSPYDIEDEGYNLLAQNPLLNVKQDGSIQNIRGITLVKRNGDTYYPLENIPTDGQFTALVMHTGTIPVSNIKERVYYYNTLGVLVELERNTEYAMTFNDNLADGILMFDFDLAKVERRDVPIHIEFNVVDEDDILVHQTFADLTTFENYYLFDTTGSNPDNYFYDPNMSPSAFHLWQKTEHYTYKDLGRLYTSKQAPSEIGDFTYYLEAGTVYKYYGTIRAKVIHPIYFEGKPMWVEGFYKFNGLTQSWEVCDSTEYESGTFKREYYYQTWKAPEDVYPDYVSDSTGLLSFVTSLVAVPNLPSRRPETIVGVIRITGAEDYVWNGTNTGVITDDFIEYEPLDSATSNFTLVTQFGNNTLEPLVSLDLSNVKLATINERLVLYKGNTIWFSVYGNPNYFPYKNYVNLSLLGNDEIVSINYFRGSHIVFTKERIYRISGYYPDITITMINDSIGCIAPSSIKSFNNTLVFLTYDGLYRLKQNYYMDGLENVEKVDNKINGLYPKDTNVESMLYNEQYLLYFKDNDDFDVLKYYYNINLPYDKHPFTIDKFAQYPDLLVKHDAYLLGLKHGELYVYDEGYTDFLLPVTTPTEQQVKDSTYKVVVKTCNMMLGYPTHDKKFKNLFIKTHTLESVPLSITTYVNDLLELDPHKYYTNLTMLGEVEYIIEETPNLETTTGLSKLGSFELGISKLGKLEMNVHKIPLSSKGKYLQLILEQTLPAYFGIQDIGIVYKVNKIRAYQ